MQRKREREGERGRERRLSLFLEGNTPCKLHGLQTAHISLLIKPSQNENSCCLCNLIIFFIIKPKSSNLWQLWNDTIGKDIDCAATSPPAKDFIFSEYDNTHLHHYCHHPHLLRHHRPHIYLHHHQEADISPSVPLSVLRRTLLGSVGLHADNPNTAWVAHKHTHKNRHAHTQEICCFVV